MRCYDATHMWWRSPLAGAARELGTAGSWAGGTAFSLGAAARHPEVRAAQVKNCARYRQYNARTLMDPSDMGTLFPGMHFGFFLAFDLERQTQLALGGCYDLGWWGTEGRSRLAISMVDGRPYPGAGAPGAAGADTGRGAVAGLVEIRLHHLGYVTDDDLLEKADICLEAPAATLFAGEQAVFVAGYLPETYASTSLSMHFELTVSSGYDPEVLLDSQDVHFAVDTSVVYGSDHVVRRPGERVGKRAGDGPVNSPCNRARHAGRASFNPGAKEAGPAGTEETALVDAEPLYLDLWQHPCSWARAHGTGYFTDAHFAVIAQYLDMLAGMGQSVASLVLSDMPWAGQMCFAVPENAARLYEYNIVRVQRAGGLIVPDFTALDRYLDMCHQRGIARSISLFGLLGNWHARDFGTPLADYADPIRVKIYDTDTGRYSFLATRAELAVYLRQLFCHLEQRGDLERCVVVGDEPYSLEQCQPLEAFLQSCSPRQLRFSYAVHSASFLADYPSGQADISLSSLLMGDPQVQAYAQALVPGKAHHSSWYPCCFPDMFNLFVRSPRIEARLMGLYTYLWNLDGILHWAFGCYVEHPMRQISYKPEKWAAGDMLLVYPDGSRVLWSLRAMNLRYAIQDFNLLRFVQRHSHAGTRIGQLELAGELAAALGIRQFPEQHEKDYEGTRYWPSNPYETKDICMGGYPDLAAWQDLLVGLVQEAVALAGAEGVGESAWSAKATETADGSAGDTGSAGSAGSPGPA